MGRRAKVRVSNNPKDLIGITKPPLNLVPPAAMIHAAEAMRDGADKYGPYNWRAKNVLASIYVGAAMRHLAQYLDGEDIDPKSGVHHLGHAIACCGIILDAESINRLIDDRPAKGAAAQLIKRFTRNK